MIITLNYNAPLGLPSGVTLQPGVPTVVHGWASDKKSKVVQAWLKKGILQEGNGLRSQFAPDLHPVAGEGGEQTGTGTPENEEKVSAGEQPGDEKPSAEAQAQDAQSEQRPGEKIDEKSELLAELEKRGIKADKRTGVKKLKALLAES